MAFLRQHRRTPHVVIIDDISRLKGGPTSAARRHRKRERFLESPSIEFGEDSDSMFVENLLASCSPSISDKKTASR